MNEPTETPGSVHPEYGPVFSSGATPEETALAIERTKERWLRLKDLEENKGRKRPSWFRQ